MNRKRTISKWGNLILGLVVLFLALGHGLEILASNAGAGSEPWGIRWTIVNIGMWVNLLWGILIFVRRIPNWILLVVSVSGLVFFAYFNYYVQYFFWLRFLILTIVCGYFVYGTYRDYRER
jgi:hypothetical protein